MIDPHGAGIIAAVRQIRTLMVEVSKLLLEADAIMGVAGWAPRVASTALAGGATSVNSPKNWIPYRAFRFYRRDERPTIIPCIAVILDEQYRQQQVTEPLVSGEMLEYDSSGDVPEGNRLYDSSTWHLHVPGRRDDGTIVEIVPREIWKGESTAKLMRSFAIPLTRVDSRERLKQAVVDPLLSLITKDTDDGAQG